MIYNEIYNFCKVKNKGLCRENGTEPTPRVQFLLSLLDKEGIDYELDQFERPNDVKKFERTGNPTNYYYNIILKGSSSHMVVAHHDIVNPNSDNANDNSCSVINAIALKKLRPNVNVVLLDGEEVGGVGSERCSKLINDGYFGSIDWVLNLELTGIGGERFFIGDYPGPLFDKIKNKFNCPVFRTPFNDSVTFRRNGIDSVVINPLPVTDKKSPIVCEDGTYLDVSILYKCHSNSDSVNDISIEDMKAFVENVLLKIV